MFETHSCRLGFVNLKCITTDISILIGYHTFRGKYQHLDTDTIVLKVPEYSESSVAIFDRLSSTKWSMTENITVKQCMGQYVWHKTWVQFSLKIGEYDTKCMTQKLLPWNLRPTIESNSNLVYKDCIISFSDTFRHCF